MLRFCKEISLRKTAWLWLIIGTLALELIALYFQHIMQLKPCVLCIYERLALFGILAAALLGVIAPSTSLRHVAILLWIYSAWEGLRLSWVHTMKILRPTPFDTCDFMVRFPTWLPLDKWLPAVFKAEGDCSVSQWRWLSLEMPQWLLIIFALFLLIALVIAVSQFVKLPRRGFFSFK